MSPAPPLWGRTEQPRKSGVFDITEYVKRRVNRLMEWSENVSEQEKVYVLPSVKGTRATHKGLRVEGEAIPANDRGYKEVWVPKSQIHDTSDVTDEGHEGDLVLKEWLVDNETPWTKPDGTEVPAWGIQNAELVKVMKGVPVTDAADLSHDDIPF